MTFTNQNSALEFLTDVSPDQLRVNPHSCDDAAQFMVGGLSELRPAFRERIQYTGVPFILESNQGFTRLKGTLPRDPIVQSGTWITNLDGHLWTFFYQLDFQPGIRVKWSGLGTILVATSDPTLARETQISLNRRQINEITFHNYSDLESAMGLPLIVMNLLNLIVFSRYCGWETRIIPPGRSGTHLNTEYLNASSFPIEVMDSAWFAQLMRDKAFCEGSREKGSFRMQRHRPGLKRQKLIWVTTRSGTAD